jgi:hypothetical protein
MNQIAKNKKKINKHFTCADFSCEMLSTFIFASRTLHSCSIRLKGSIKEAHLVFTFFKSFNPLASMSSTSLTNSICLFSELEVSMGALQQTLNAAHDIELRQCFEGQVATMGHTMQIECKWSVLTVNLLGDSRF